MIEGRLKIQEMEDRNACAREGDIVDAGEIKVSILPGVWM